MMDAAKEHVIAVIDTTPGQFDRWGCDCSTTRDDDVVVALRIGGLTLLLCQDCVDALHAALAVRAACKGGK